MQGQIWPQGIHLKCMIENEYLYFTKVICELCRRNCESNFPLNSVSLIEEATQDLRFLSPDLHSKDLLFP